MADLSDEIKLYGTEEPVPPTQELVAGQLTATFDQGALRYIKVSGTEAIRNIAFVVRNKDWGTYHPSIEDVDINQSDDGFTVSYSATCGIEASQINYKASIAASRKGELTFTVRYQATTDFVTNRTGFVVLHPIQGIAGQPVIVEEVDGTVFESEFPQHVDPIQPFKNLRALTHQVSEKTSLRCEMLGDSFEMEDHRQWNDASYKTYVRPLELPWPYTVPQNTPLEQAVKLSVIAEGPKSNSSSSANSHKIPCQVTVKKAQHNLTMPRIGLGLEPQHLASAKSKIELLNHLGLQQIVVWHCLEQHGATELRQAAELSNALQVDSVLHAVIPDVDYQAEVLELANQCRKAGFTAKAVCVSPSVYLKSIMPGPDWPDVTPLEKIYDEVSSVFTDSTIGGGMLAFFPELNRHKPPINHLDYVTHSSNTITHASDDITTMENLEALSHIINSCRTFIKDKPYHLGPSSIGMRFNPYGSATMENPQNQRIAMARMDPRQRGLFNAAWTFGYLAHASRASINTVNLHAPTGEFGLIYHPEAWNQPGFDGTERQVFPAYHVVAGFASACGHTVCPVLSSQSQGVEAVAFEEHGTQTLWIANLTNDTLDVEVSGFDVTSANVTSLSLNTWDQCTLDRNGMSTTVANTKSNKLAFGAYEVMCLTSTYTF